MEFLPDYRSPSHYFFSALSVPPCYSVYLPLSLSISIIMVSELYCLTSILSTNSVSLILLCQIRKIRKIQKKQNHSGTNGQNNKQPTLSYLTKWKHCFWNPTIYEWALKSSKSSVQSFFGSLENTHFWWRPQKHMMAPSPKSCQTYKY